MFEGGFAGAEQVVDLLLYTDAYVARGSVATRKRRLTDILNHAEEGFIVLRDAAFEPLSGGATPIRAPYAQVNLAAVLFAVATTPSEPAPDLRTPKLPEAALIMVPPFLVAGRIHLLPDRDLQEGLGELTGRFVPVTDARYWSDSLGLPAREALMVAINHDRAQILAPYDGPAPEG
jgi:hypothetical protein